MSKAAVVYPKSAFSTLQQLLSERLILDSLARATIVSYLFFLLIYPKNFSSQKSSGTSSGLYIHVSGKYL